MSSDGFLTALFRAGGASKRDAAIMGGDVDLLILNDDYDIDDALITGKTALALDMACSDDYDEY